MQFKNRIGFLAIVIASVVAGARYFSEDRQGISYIETEIASGDIVVSISAVGSLRPIGMVEISSSTSGQIAEINVDFNDTVKKGEPLAVLDRRVLVANLKEVRAALAVAQANAEMAKARITKADADLADARLRGEVARSKIDGSFAKHSQIESALNRTRLLLKRKSVAASELERAEYAFQASLSELAIARLEQEVAQMRIQSAVADVTIAKVELTNARAAIQQREASVDRAIIELERATVRAPIDGLVVGRSVELGQTVSASLEAPTLFTLAEDLKNMEVRAIIDESDIIRIRLNQIATVTVDALEDRSYSGKVTQIRRLSDDEDGVVTYTIVLTVQNPDLILLPGMTALVDIVVEEHLDVVKVPNSALRFRPQDADRLLEIAQLETLSFDVGQLIWKQDDVGGLLPLVIEGGLTDGTATAMVKGELNAGDHVVIGTRVTRDVRGLFGLKIGF
ncbi:efflux RND transporter periplasmic adaptor subunit [Parasedimentitalea maritima]|uniref:HlyD family efflux transporter periplasmic adaptor subunit n=1 Tax=Parasedimentitalea maritima TaxID=2578117 RepID=A0A6A4R9C9_9RHOB|nr:efflux RND transporter periplasmic adaptor subunit [Zongyanglinia marina]KAE9625127.1 HlyD family efflux transporter periplasmic adaptor subunit [Zongyanglinia marina]